MHSQEDLVKELQDPSLQGMTALAIYTCGVSCFKWDGMLECPVNSKDGDIADWDHLLEIRLFDESKELYAFRDSMMSSFYWRWKDDANQLSPDSYIDDVQLLDNEEGNSYKSIAGGAYKLPLANADRLVVRNYLEYDEGEETDGAYRVTDFRIVKFLEAGESYNGK